MHYLKIILLSVLALINILFGAEGRQLLTSKDIDKETKVCRTVLSFIKNDTLHGDLKLESVPPFKSVEEGASCGDAETEHEILTSLHGKKCSKCILGSVGPDKNNGVVFVDGPAGSLRHWDIIVAVDIGNGKTLGTCLETSTMAWRGINTDKKAGLEFFYDTNDDKENELIIWNSFGQFEELVDDRYPMASVIMPEIYRFDPEGKLVWSPERGKKLFETWANIYNDSAAKSKYKIIREIQRGTAKAYRAFAEDKPCP